MTETRTHASDMRQWIIFARLGGQIEAADAAARLSAVDRAARNGEAIPDIRDEEQRQNSWPWQDIAPRFPVEDG